MSGSTSPPNCLLTFGSYCPKWNFQALCDKEGCLLSTRVEVQELSPHHFAVEVREGEIHNTHKVAVPPEFLDDLGMFDVDLSELVYESFEFLLDREPASSIVGDFPLDEIPMHFPDYFDEIRRRLGV